MIFLSKIFAIVAVACTANAITNNLGIIEGTGTLAHFAPYKAFLSRDGNMKTRCGGTLVSQNYVLTAAQCLQNTKTVKVVLGAFDLNEIGQNGEVSFDVTSDDFTVHQDFNATSLENDIALIKLPQTVELNENITTIPLATIGDVQDLVGKQVVTLGWGTVSGYLPDLYSDVPYAIWINVTSNTDGECIEEFGDKIKTTNICCTSYNSWQNAMNICDGDYGGPLVRDYSVLVGVASFTNSIRCDLGSPNVFTDVSKYTSWIKINSDVTPA